MTANLALLPMAGAAARQIFDSVAGAVSNGLSFAASLGSPDKAADAADVPSTATAADGALRHHQRRQTPAMAGRLATIETRRRGVGTSRARTTGRR